MSPKPSVFLRALLTAAPLFCEPAVSRDPQVGKNRQLIWLSIDDAKPRIVEILGQPKVAAQFGADFEAWQYQLAQGDHDDFSHQLVFRRSTGKLISITRNYEPQCDLSAFFPAGETTVYSTRGPSSYVFLVRRLADGSVLLSPGLADPNQPGGQITVMRESELKYFYPMLAEKLRVE